MAILRLGASEQCAVRWVFPQMVVPVPDLVVPAFAELAFAPFVQVSADRPVRPAHPGRVELVFPSAF